MNFLKKYEYWLNSDSIDEKDKEELRNLKGNQKEIEDRFFKDLSFGTGGIRGVRGIGTNRINKYMIRKATQGLANYMLKYNEKEAKERGIIIAHDCRIGSREYALNTARVMAANGIKAYIYPDLRSTPELSFGVRYKGCLAGIVVTASHNPVEYNGYKVYWEDGAQVVDPHATSIVAEVNKIATLEEIKEAAKIAVADGFISEMKDGYNSFIGERGATLSGGQKQRLAIARALLTNADIIIMDEAVSNLDSESEAEFRMALDNISRQKTIITIAHRSSTIMAAKRVVILEEGKITVSEKPEEWIKRNNIK